jgi:hypothetical protein
MSETQKISSLTSPMDINTKYKPEQEYSLTNEECKHAFKDLNNDSFTQRYPKTDRTYADPSIPLQVYGLISFIPSEGSKPDKNGIYGFAKIRGNFGTDTEANQKAEQLIRKVDSFHKIYHTYVGRPFPITTISDFSEEKCNVNIEKEGVKVVKNDINKNKKQQKDSENELQERSKNITKSVQEEISSFDQYITEKVKNAQLKDRFIQHLKALLEIKDILSDNTEVINHAESENPEFVDKYLDKYKDARKSAGISNDNETFQNSFMKFMINDDIILPGIDVYTEEFNLIVNKASEI